MGKNKIKIIGIISIGIILSLFCFSAYALMSGVFHSTSHMAESENILIVNVPTTYFSTQPQYQEDGVIDYEVELLQILKGNDVKIGENVKISTTQPLTPKTKYLLIGKSSSRNGKPWLLFHWQLGVVKLPDNFNIHILEGKDIKEKITAILSERHTEVMTKIKELENEKQQIEALISK